MTHFDALAPDYDRLRPAGEGWHELAEHTLAALAGATRLLDVGCGTGRFAVLAAERLGARVWGVDASAEMLTTARARPGAGRVGWRRPRRQSSRFGTGGSTRPTPTWCFISSTTGRPRSPSSGE